MRSAETEHRTYAKTEVTLFLLTEVSYVKSRFHAHSDQLADRDIHRNRYQHGEFGLIEAAITSAGQGLNRCRTGMRIEVHLPEYAAQQDLGRRLHSRLVQEPELRPRQIAVLLEVKTR